MFAIDANRNGFIQRLIDLANKGLHYSMIVDGSVLNKCSLDKRNPKEIHILPTIVGSAGVVTAIGVVLYAAAAFAPQWAVGVLLALGSATLSYGISNLMQKDQKTDVGSASATSNASNKSFLFSNGENIAEQGIPVPIGYGRLRIGSSVIQSTIKSYPAKFDENNSLPIYSEFVELATKRGLSQMSIISRQQQEITTPV
jgi:predicted phage tail protein